MEEITVNLETLQISLPINCTRYNIHRLKMKFGEYRSIVASLNDNYSSVRKHCERTFDFIKSRIDAIDNNNQFQEAVDHLKTQIAMVLLSIKSKTA